ncbi:MAG: hypothetical protein GTN71_24580 [Anaerolineae bacterium]|nr:hypothetical protein [Anaerolineae bacterium]
MDVAKVLESSLERLEPTGDYNQSLAKVLLAHARRNLVKYDLMIKNFEKKYGMSFTEFSDSDLMKEPVFEVEQDFFDWDMAVTGLEDMRQEIQLLVEAELL